MVSDRLTFNRSSIRSTNHRDKNKCHSALYSRLHGDGLTKSQQTQFRRQRGNKDDVRTTEDQEQIQRVLKAFGHDPIETQTQDRSDNHSRGGLASEKDDRSNSTRTNSSIFTTHLLSNTSRGESKRGSSPNSQYHPDETGHAHTNILRHPHSNKVFERSALLLEEEIPYDSPPGTYDDGGSHKRWNSALQIWQVDDDEEQSGRGHEVDEVERELLSDLENDYHTRGW
ncbi:hypothetical protein V865_001811 [Kwoniella europaea PYCC6329]|uniref:Uncharacterized protein n=1 Tax=Kwoniella europaea PYCC6329 TaxID=1423913 RepID=A0AAX4KBJ9_9TREE